MSVAPPPPSPDASAVDQALAAGARALAELGVQDRVDLTGDTVAVSPRRDRRRDRRSARAPRHERAHRPLHRRLVAPLATATVFDIFLSLRDRLPAVDGLAHFETGRNLLSGAGYSRGGAPELHFPPVVPVGLRLLELATGSEMAALGVWNVITSVAVVAALVGLAHRLWCDADVTVATAWLGGLMAGLGPVFYRYGSGSEPAALALVLAAMLAALRGLDERSSARVPVRAGWLAGSGLLVGLAYLTRPEALLPGMVVGLATVLWTWHHATQPMGPRIRPFVALGRDLAATPSGPAYGTSAPPSPLDMVPAVRGRSALSRWCRRGLPVVAAFGLGAAILITPYAVYLHANTGKWSLTAKSQDVSIEAWRAVAEGQRLVRDQYLYKLNPDGTLGADTKSLTALAVDDPAGWAGIVGVNARVIWRSYVGPIWGYGPAWRLVPAPLVALALFEMWKQRRRRATQLLVGVGVVPLVTCLAFFSLPRYLGLPTAMVTLFAARGLLRACRALPRWGAIPLVAVTMVFVVLSALTQVRGFLPGERTADPVEAQHAAKWIEANTPPGTRVMTRSFHVQAYSHRPIVAVPAADYTSTILFASQMGVHYVVLDYRSALYWWAQRDGARPDLQLVAVFGDSAYPIHVYRLTPLPPPSSRDPIPLGYVSD